MRRYATPIQATSQRNHRMTVTTVAMRNPAWPEPSRCERLVTPGVVVSVTDLPSGECDADVLHGGITMGDGEDTLVLAVVDDEFIGTALGHQDPTPACNKDFLT